MWLAGSTHAGQVISGTAWRPTVRWLSARRWGCRFTLAGAGFGASGAHLVVLLPIIMRWVIYGIPGISTARPRVPVLPGSRLCVAAEQEDLCSGALVLPP